jgi:magnesium transporter
LIIVHSLPKGPHAAAASNGLRLAEGQAIPPDAIWIDLLCPTTEEDRLVQDFAGCTVPTKADPDYTEPPEAHYADNGARYVHASVVSEADDTPDVTGVTFVIAAKTLVTVRYDSADSFDLYASKFAKTAPAALSPDAIALGLINTVLNRSARALAISGAGLERIGNAVFHAKDSDQATRNRIYTETLSALGREDEKVSNLRESMASLERLLLFLSAEGRPEDLSKSVKQATRAALRDLQSLEEDASFKAQKVQFLLDATLGLINLAQNDIIKLFSVLAVIFMPPTLIASIYGMNFKAMPELDWPWGYPLALCAMVCAAIGPYVFFRWKKWL